MWELLLSPKGGTKLKNNPLWLSASRTQPINWVAFKFTLPPPHLGGKLRKSTTQIVSVVVHKPSLPQLI